ncbi:MAG: CPBP family intramembrane metalloprotease [Oscillospiraceae bacterium]|nr:CPBP family intramembrane metalloprotease [Oscillospiraceae bacterium]
MEQIEEIDDKQTVRGYKSVCAKLGLSMCIYFICRFLMGYAEPVLSRLYGRLPLDFAIVLHHIVIILTVYVIPLFFTVRIFKYRTPLRTLYKKPRRIAPALGTLPAVIGLGHGIALLTLLASFILSKTLGGDTYIEDLLRPTTIEATSNITQLVMMVILMIVVAPIFEEYWVRGIMFDALKPYGTGMAIIISALLFGIMHGSLYMFFYTTAYGLALGYIRYATGSLFIATILHACVNSIGAIALLLLSLVEMTLEQNKVINTVNMIYLIAAFLMIIIGVIVFLTKIPKIKKYRFENTWTQIGPLKKFGIFIASIPVIIMMILAVIEIAGYILINRLIG